MEKIRVIYIAGEGRSGSTLLERILGQHKDIFAAGELIHIWERGIIENQLCGCNKRFYECDFWKKVYEDIKDIDAEEMLGLLDRARMRNYIKGLDKNVVDEINKSYTELYNSILKHSGKKYIVDSSKHPIFAYILSQNENINLYVIHLIRDLRGVAYSWKKKKIRPEIVEKQEYMPRFSIFRTAVYWILVNKLLLKFRKNFKHYHQIWYEDILSNPVGKINEIAKFLSLDSFDEVFIDENKINLSVNHTVAGNPFRFKTGEIELKIDNEWEENLSFPQKLILGTCNKVIKNAKK